MASEPSLETRIAVLESRFDDLMQRVDNSASKMDKLIDQLAGVSNKLTGFSVYYKVLWPVVTILVGVVGWLAGVKFF